jgi:N-formylglutamate amidohydrolase
MIPIPLRSDTIEPAASQVRVIRPSQQTSPLLVASPHSGRDYPDHFVTASRLDRHMLRRSEDCFVDELLAGAASHGIPLLLADFPRAYCDVNREQWELDPTMFVETLPAWCNTRTVRVGAGFGTIAKLVSSGQPIYAGKLRFVDAEARIRSCWQPYHAALADLIEQTRMQFGLSVLLDCHSMPSDDDATSQGDPDFVLGDAYGSACDPVLTRTAHRFLEDAGYRVRRNDPYAGGYVTRHYGRPRSGCHALQVEIARRLYVDQRAYRKLADFDRIEALLSSLLVTLREAATALATG